MDLHHRRPFSSTRGRRRPATPGASEPPRPCHRLPHLQAPPMCAPPAPPCHPTAGRLQGRTTAAAFGLAAPPWDTTRSPNCPNGSKSPPLPIKTLLSGANPPGGPSRTPRRRSWRYGSSTGGTWERAYSLSLAGAPELKTEAAMPLLIHRVEGRIWLDTRRALVYYESNAYHRVLV